MKNNLNLLKLFIAVTLTISITSCDKEKTTEYQSDNSAKTVLVSNPNNPYDTLGAHHNELMSECFTLIQQYENTYGNITNYHAITLANRVLAENDLDTSNTRDIANTVGASVNDNFHTVINNSAPNQRCSLFTIALVDSVYTRSRTGEYGYSDLYDYIIHKETYVLGSIDYTTEDLRYILSFTSVLRYSLYFWYDSFRGQMTLAKLPFWKWACRIAVTAVCDAVGATVPGGGAATAVSASSAGYNIAKDIFTDDPEPGDTTQNAKSWNM